MLSSTSRGKITLCQLEIMYLSASERLFKIDSLILDIALYKQNLKLTNGT